MIFKKIFLFLGFISTAIASTNSYQIMSGNYNMQLVLTDSQESYPASVTFSINDVGIIKYGNIEYPTYECKASLHNKKENKNIIKFKEKMKFGYDNCSPSEYTILINKKYYFNPSSDKYITFKMFDGEENVNIDLKKYNYKRTKYSTYRIKNKIKNLNQIFKSTNSLLLRKYIKLTNDKVLKLDAKKLLIKLIKEENQTYEKVKLSQKIKDYKKYIIKYPGTKHIKSANNKIAQIEKELLIASYREKATPESFYKAYKLSNQNSDIEKILLVMKDLKLLNNFIAKHNSLLSHNLVKDKYINFYRKKATPISYYNAFLISNENDDVKMLLKKMNSLNQLKKFISNKNILSLNLLIKAKLAKFHRKENSFEGYIQAYNLLNNIDDINKAYTTIINSNSKQIVRQISLDIFYNNYVHHVSNMDNFLKFLSKIKNIDNKKYHLKLMKSNGFGNNITLNNFFNSNEYKKILHKFKPKVNESGKKDDFTYYITYPNKTFSFTLNSKCEYYGEEYKDVSVNILFGILGGYDERRFYNIDECTAYSKDLNKIASFEKKLLKYSTDHNIKWKKKTYTHAVRLDNKNSNQSMCYGINNNDMKNSCIATTTNNKNMCYSIKNKDIMNSCIATITNDTGFCYSINSKDIQNSCIAQIKNDTGFCYSINNKDTQNSCIAKTKREKGFCYSIKNKDMQNDCIANF